MDPGSQMGLFSVQEVCGKGPVDSEAKQKTPGVLEMCGGEGGGGQQAPPSVSVRANMGGARPQRLTFFILLAGGGGCSPGLEPAILASQRSATH